MDTRFASLRWSGYILRCRLDRSGLFRTVLTVHVTEEKRKAKRGADYSMEYCLLPLGNGDRVLRKHLPRKIQLCVEEVYDKDSWLVSGPVHVDYGDSLGANFRMKLEEQGGDELEKSWPFTFQAGVGTVESALYSDDFYLGFPRLLNHILRLGEANSLFGEFCSEVKKARAALASLVMWKCDSGEKDEGCARSYGVNLLTLMAVSSDDPVCGQVVRAAEGQMVRCFAKAKGRSSKLMFFECWMGCLSRLVGFGEMATVSINYNTELSSAQREWELVRAGAIVGRGVAAHKEALKVVDGSLERMANIMAEGRKHIPGVHFEASLVEKCWGVEGHVGKFGSECLAEMQVLGVCKHQ
jgi:hypothetical protein